MGDGPRPAVKRRRLRAELRNARQEAELTQEQVAEAMDWSLSKIIRIEAGSVGVSTNDMKALLKLYGISDPDRTEELLALAREARERSTAFKGAPPRLMRFIEYEAAASAIRGFQPLLVPGLLQTEEYARAVLQQLMPEESRAELDALVKVRMKRQEVLLGRSDLKQLLFILDEAALRRQVGGAAAMRRQVRHLAEMAKGPKVTLEVIPFSAGAHPGMQGPFVIFEFPDADDVLFLETSGGDLIIRDEREDIAIHEEQLDALHRLSLGRKGSQGFLDDVAAQTNGQS